jgi:pyruvate dehydrogenase E1 component beta subunit
MPSTPHDAKGLLVAAVNDGNPVLYIDDRWLYEQQGEVPESLYSVPLGKAALRRTGRHVTVVATSCMTNEGLRAAEALAARGIDVEVIDLRTIKPWDRDMVFSSVGKTGRLVVADAAWMSGGVAADIAATVAGELFHALQAPIVRVCLPDAPAPTSAALEDAYYVGAKDIVVAVEKVLR